LFSLTAFDCITVVTQNFIDEKERIPWHTFTPNTL
jgi:hypothetical protein